MGLLGWGGLPAGELHGAPTGTHLVAQSSTMSDGSGVSRASMACATGALTARRTHAAAARLAVAG